MTALDVLHRFADLRPGQEWAAVEALSWDLREEGFGELELQEAADESGQGAASFTQALVEDGQEVALAYFERDDEGLLVRAGLAWQQADGLDEGEVAGAAHRLHEAVCDVLGAPHAWLDRTVAWLEEGAPADEVIFSACWSEGAPAAQRPGAVDTVAAYRAAVRAAGAPVATLNVTVSGGRRSGRSLQALLTVQG